VNPCYCKQLKKNMHDLRYQWGWVKRIRVASYEYDLCTWQYRCARCRRKYIKVEIINDTRPANWLALWEAQRALAKEKLVTLLAENPNMSLTAMAKGIGVSRETARKYAKSIQQEAS
jgi:hypothetical protein